MTNALLVCLFLSSFLEYFTREDAEHAVRTLDGKRLGGTTVRVFSYNDVSASPTLCLSMGMIG